MPTSRETDEYSFVLSEGEGELHVRFEPVGPDYIIATNDHLKVHVQSPANDPIEITSGNGWVTIWAAPSAQIRAVNRQGEPLKFLY